jgi:phage shock protein C
MVYCLKCGKKASEDSIYCSKCGADLKKAENLSQLEKNIEHFGEEMGKIGKKIKKTVEDVAETQKEKDSEYKKLYRSGKNKIIAGVCGGLGEYFKIDPLLIRVIFVVALLPTVGTLILGYLLLWVLLPRNPTHKW